MEWYVLRRTRDRTLFSVRINNDASIRVEWTTMCGPVAALVKGRPGCDGLVAYAYPDSAPYKCHTPRPVLSATAKCEGSPIAHTFVASSESADGSLSAAIACQGDASGHAEIVALL